MAAATEEWVSISRPPTRWEKFFDLGFRGLTYVVAGLTVAVGPVHRGDHWPFGGPGDPSARPGLPDGNRLGSQQGTVRHPAANLGNALQFRAGRGDRNRPGTGGGGVSQRAAAFLVCLSRVEAVRVAIPRFLGKAAGRPGIAAEELDRASGGDPQRGLRTVGHLRGHSLDPAGVQLGPPDHGRDPAVQDGAVRPRDAPGGHRAGDHDPADHFRHQPRRAGQRAAEAAGSGLRAGRDPLGSHPVGDPPDGPNRHLRRRPVGLWPRPGRNHGLGHVGGERQRD